MTMSDQYYSTIWTSVVLAVTNGKPPCLRNKVKKGFPLQYEEAKPLGMKREINIQCINCKCWRRGSRMSGEHIK